MVCCVKNRIISYKINDWVFIPNYSQQIIFIINQQIKHKKYYLLLDVV